MQNIDNKHIAFTENCVKTVKTAPWAYRNCINFEIKKQYNILIIKYFIKKRVQKQHPE